MHAPATLQKLYRLFGFYDLEDRITIYLKDYLKLANKMW